jgi:hypothetical protein
MEVQSLAWVRLLQELPVFVAYFYYLQLISAARWLLHRVDYMLRACQPILMVRNSKLYLEWPYLTYRPVTYLSSGGKVGDKILAVCIFVRYSQYRANFAIGGDLR